MKQQDSPTSNRNVDSKESSPEETVGVANHLSSAKKGNGTVTTDRRVSTSTVTGTSTCSTGCTGGAGSHSASSQQPKILDNSNCNSSKGNGGIMTSDMDVRSWFENLPSGEERSASMAISDPAFVGMLVSIVCNGSSCSSSFLTPQGLALSNEPVKVKDLTEAYNMHTLSAQQPELSTTTSHHSKPPKSKGPLNDSDEKEQTKNQQQAEEELEEQCSADKTSQSDSNTDSDIVLSSPTAIEDESMQITSSNSDGADSKLICNGEPFKEEIDSTAFRIQPQTENEKLTSAGNETDSAIDDEATTTTISVTKSHEITTTLSKENLSDESTDESGSCNEGASSIATSSSIGEHKTEGEPSHNLTTLHFKSGLSLTISASSEANKKVIATAGKKRSASLPTISNLGSTSPVNNNVQNNQEGNDVDQLLHFSALNIATTTTTNSKIQSSSSHNNATIDASSRHKDAAKRKKAQKISLSKLSASRAMSLQQSSATSLTSSNTGNASISLLQHVCLVFTSALGTITSNNTNKKGTRHNSSQKKKSQHNQNLQQIELLTIDPHYLNKKTQNGSGNGSLEFLNDVDQIIETESKKIRKGQSHDDKHNFPKFLSGTSLRVDESSPLGFHSVDLKPNWFACFTESEDVPIPAIIVLLARIEQSVRESYNFANKINSSISESSSTKNLKRVHIASAKDSLNVVTPPSSPLQLDEIAENTDKTTKSSEDNVTTQSKQETNNGAITVKTKAQSKELSTNKNNLFSPSPPLPFLLPKREQAATPTIDSLFTETLGSWKLLSEKNLHNEVIQNTRELIQGVMNKAPNQWHQDAEKAISSFALKDLLLVPICSVLLIRPPSKLGVNQSLAYVRLLVSQWTQIITSCLSKLKDEISKLELLEANDPLVDDLDGLLDDNAVAKPGSNGKKKKKKKKKKKRKPTASSNVGNSHEQKLKNPGMALSKDTTKKKDEEVKKPNTTSVNDCAVSVVSSVSVATNSSKRTPRSDNTPVESTTAGDGSVSNVNMPVPQASSRNGACVVGVVRVEETDCQSSDGWETVEPKGGRSRRLAISALKSTERQPNDTSSNNVPQSPNASRRNKGKTKNRQRTKQKFKDKETPKRLSEALEEGIVKRGANTTRALMEERNKRPSSDKKKETVREVSARSSIADQNTAQTIPESLSGVSSAPVQTLVAPGNNNSASSSVASSLDAPHATRHKPHHYHESYKEDDVGYHLLKLCDRLSVDMSTFMKRRASALTVRRRERGVLLSALQETVQTIWEGHCHVEMYGSCATQLDLPSSDLDVVIRGLDGSENLFVAQNEVNKSYEKESSSSIETQSKAFEGQGHKVTSLPSTSPNVTSRQYMNYPQHFYQPLSANGNRVLRLATELEKQPWAVQVKAIPTASVPVIKILADPSRLPGATTGIEWMLHQQHMADMKMVGGIPPNTHGSYHSSQFPWRGQDIMNGLLSLDITFEGPEHGGVGSTAFSAQVVQDVVSKTGLPPESTPAVQVIMVIKELLAQRRLNEPFSGGLSSYAILLLVVAVMKEREIIKGEIERVERQRHAVSSECTKVKSEKKSQLKRSSWATIAKKSSTTQDICEEESKKDVSIEKPTQSAQHEETRLNEDGESVEAQESTLFPQSYNDVLEVLCSGEASAGKLLLHFLLFYGRHFDARSACIDVSGTHHPEYGQIKNDPKRNWSPFMARKAGGTYNPITEVYTVDPFVVYDPLEGRESNNVARSCYAWPTIAWTFDQCFNTLSGVVELGLETNNDIRGRGNKNVNAPSQTSSCSQKPTVSNCPQPSSTNANESERSHDAENDVSPLLELFLRF